MFSIKITFFSLVVLYLSLNLKLSVISALKHNSILFLFYLSITKARSVYQLINLLLYTDSADANTDSTDATGSVDSADLTE